MPATSVPFADQLTVGATAVRYTSSSLVMQMGVTIKAKAGNTGKVHVGFSDQVTTSTGFELSAGEALHLERTKCPDLTNLWFIATGASQGVCLLAE